MKINLVWTSRELEIEQCKLAYARGAAVLQQLASSIKTVKEKQRGRLREVKRQEKFARLEKKAATSRRTPKEGKKL
jgi:hypothetical protein